MFSANHTPSKQPLLKTSDWSFWAWTGLHLLPLYSSLYVFLCQPLPPTVLAARRSCGLISLTQPSCFNHYYPSVDILGMHITHPPSHCPTSVKWKWCEFESWFQNDRLELWSIMVEFHACWIIVNLSRGVIWSSEIMLPTVTTKCSSWCT